MKKTLAEIIDDLCAYIKEHNSIRNVKIEGEKTNILIEVKNKDNKKTVK
jgi:hypothetical protein